MHLRVERSLPSNRLWITLSPIWLQLAHCEPLPIYATFVAGETILVSVTQEGVGGDVGNPNFGRSVRGSIDSDFAIKFSFCSFFRDLGWRRNMGLPSHFEKPQWRNTDPPPTVTVRSFSLQSRGGDPHGFWICSFWMNCPRSYLLRVFLSPLSSISWHMTKYSIWHFVTKLTKRFVSVRNVLLKSRKSAKRQNGKRDQRRVGRIWLMRATHRKLDLLPTCLFLHERIPSLDVTADFERENKSGQRWK